MASWLTHGRVLQVAAVVVEREQRLRQAMRTMGMLDSAYWASWAAYEVRGLPVMPMLMTPCATLVSSL